ncbi:MAG: hypothetical protein KDA28_03180 [Phycisphaerales bacterium]|nr:hypothetical protein [Phycisphaerales bacterium]
MDHATADGVAVDGLTDDGAALDSKSATGVADDEAREESDSSLDEETAQTRALQLALNEEIAQRFAEERSAVTGLEREYREATSAEARTEIDRRAREIQLHTWREVLAIQAKFATLAGQTDRAERLAARIQRLDADLSQPAQAGSTRHGSEGGAK